MECFVCLLLFSERGTLAGSTESGSKLYGILRTPSLPNSVQRGGGCSSNTVIFSSTSKKRVRINDEKSSTEKLCKYNRY